MRLNGQIPEQFAETDLMRLFNISRYMLRGVLSRIQQEGWIEQRAGQGWQFLPMIDSVEAYEESYSFRAIIEPAGLLAPTFMVDTEALARCKKQQQFIADGGYLTMTPQELFESNAQFHETLASFSGNRFHVQTVRRLDQLRRLVEYRQASKRAPRREQAVEHLAILACLEKVIGWQQLIICVSTWSKLAGIKSQLSCLRQLSCLLRLLLSRPELTVRTARSVPLSFRFKSRIADLLRQRAPIRSAPVDIRQSDVTKGPLCEPRTTQDSFSCALIAFSCISHAAPSK